MQQVVFDVSYTEKRNRGTTAIRAILAIPHVLLLGAWQSVAQIGARADVVPTVGHDCQYFG